MSSTTIIRDAPNCGVTHEDLRGIIDDRNVFILKATGFKQYLKQFLHLQSFFVRPPATITCVRQYWTCLGYLGLYDPIETDIHKWCGSGIFAQWCNFSRKFSIFSNCHWEQQRQECNVLSPVYTALEMILFLSHHPRWPRQMRGT